MQVRTMTLSPGSPVFSLRKLGGAWYGICQRGIIYVRTKKHCPLTLIPASIMLIWRKDASPTFLQLCLVPEWECVNILYTVALTLNCGFEDAFCGNGCVGVSHVHCYHQTVAVCHNLHLVFMSWSGFLLRKGKMIGHKLHEELKKFAILCLEIHWYKSGKTTWQLQGRHGGVIRGTSP